MNLHIAPDNVFTNRFLDNLHELGIASKNRVVVRTNQPRLKHIDRDVSFSPLYSRSFKSHVGNTRDYDRVYIHQFTPLLYRWVALNDFNELNWAVWGADLYNLPFNQRFLYEPLTLSRFINKRILWPELLYRAKVALLHNPYRSSAYAKVRNILTWMPNEYNFAKATLPSLKAGHQFFFYENQLPYRELDTVGDQRSTSETRPPVFILGNSSTPDLNHLDAVTWMQEHRIKADLKIPISYGDAHYARFLRKSLKFYTGGEIEFVDRYMTIHEYVSFLNSCDGLIMNNVRPQGYGNIFLMMYLRKPVFLNSRNISIPDLESRNFIWEPLESLKEMSFRKRPDNRSAVLDMLSHDNLLEVYRRLFS